MDELSQILARTDTATTERKQAQEELNQFILDVRNGKRTTGDMVRDFAVAYSRIEEKDVERLREIEQRLAGAQGQPLLVHTRFRYGRERQSHEDDDGDFGCFPRPRSILDRDKDLSLLRFGIVGTPQWSLGGLDVAQPYAFQLLESPEWARDEPLLRFEEWTPHDGLLRIGAAEFFDQKFYWPISWYARPEIDDLRQDLSPEILKALNKGPVSLNNKVYEQKTDILIGEQVTEAIHKWGLFERSMRGVKGLDNDQAVSRNLADAMCCIEHRMTLDGYEKKQAADLLDRQRGIFQKVVDATLMHSDSLPQLLREAEELKVHETGLIYSPRKGMTVQASEFLPEFYRQEERFAGVYRAAAELEDEK